MKANSTPFRMTRNLRGVALVLVLSFLVIISGLVIAFFSMVTTEASSANTAAAGASAKALADSAVSFVMGTIVDATAGHDPSEKQSSGVTNAWVWASQPGMIRTYDNAGNATYVYKLYSADDMRLAGAAPTTTDTASLSQWATGNMRDVWVDMNEPLKDAAQNDVFPIVDPTAADDYDGSKFPGHVDRNNSHKVAGFHVLPNTSDSNAPSYDSRNNNPAPMPVKWLYVLQDGTMTTAKATGTDVTLNGSKASKTNPIKGRIAFWTDDETCKVNINTASQGSYWDTPRVLSPEDTGSYVSGAISGSGPQVQVPGLAICQPAKGEYQRYAGHPATTSLSPIFSYTGSGTNAALTPVLPIATAPVGTQISYTQESTTTEKYYSLTPRILGGYSYGGTQMYNPATQKAPDGNFYRLYASLDELLFSAVQPPGPTGNDSIHRLPNVPDTNGTSNSSTVAHSLITPDMYQKAKFFLTPDSNAPEVTLYNTPRVSMWPIADTTKTNPITGVQMQLTAYDQLAKFCSTVGASSTSTGTVTNQGYPFYFTRYNPRSQDADFTDPNNRLLYNYLRHLTALPVPGNAKGAGSATFARKYPVGVVGSSENDQILTCIYDYIRITNMQDSTPDPTAQNSTTPYKYYQYTPIDSIGTGASVSDNYKGTLGAGEVVPIRIDNSMFGGAGQTRGFGRFDTIGGAYLLLFAAHGYVWNTDNTHNYGPVKPPAPFPQNVPTLPPGYSAEGPIPAGAGTPVAGVTDALGVVFMLTFNCPAEGYVGNHPKTCYEVDGLDKLVFKWGPFTPRPTTATPNPTLPDNGTGGTFHGKAVGGAGSTVLPSTGLNVIYNSDVRTWHGRGVGGTSGPIMAFTDGIFGTYPYYFADDGTTPLAQKICRNAGLMNYDPTNYPFFGYTDRITPGLDKSGSFNYYYPTTLTIDMQSPSDMIKVKVFASEDRNTALQTINLHFPMGKFRMPYLTPQATDQTLAVGTTTINANYDGPSNAAAGKFFFNLRIPTTQDVDKIILAYDTVVGLEPAGVSYMGVTGSYVADSTIDHTAGDQRMYATLGGTGSNPVPAGYFQPDFFYGNAASLSESTIAAQSSSEFPSFAYNMLRSVGAIRATDGNPVIETGTYWGVSPLGAPGVPAAQAGSFNMGSYVNTSSDYSRLPDVPRRVGPTKGGGYVARTDGGFASWDTGTGLHKDGAYINKPDEGDQGLIAQYPRSSNPPFYRRPYIDKEDYLQNSGSYFSPNRQVPSSMMIGSIPTGIQERKPWQTLLFHPPLKGEKTSHPGVQPPADYYMADLFWIPVVEPYAISQPFSTSGKINMNYQIEPFTYIHRDTGMRAVLASMKLDAIPLTASTISQYKPFDPQDATVLGQFGYTTRLPLNLDATMTMFNSKFAVDQDIYRSATEVSNVMLIPQDPTNTTLKGLTGTESAAQLTTIMDTYWGTGRELTIGSLTTHALTGNNLRNKPYADMYGRLTTKSNTFTVHVRAQALRKAPGTDPAHWVSGADQVVAEYRGSSIIERYIDANDPNLPNFAQLVVNDPTNSALDIDQYYKFRVVSTKRFSP